MSDKIRAYGAIGEIDYVSTLSARPSAGPAPVDAAATPANESLRKDRRENAKTLRSRTDKLY